jgi:D-arabinose 1-dehydrogenase-like Zn-dependent alcohol dehydrogenase
VSHADQSIRDQRERRHGGALPGPLKQLSLSGGLLNDSRRSIYGNYIGSRADTTQTLAFSSKHGIAAIVDVMPLARVNEAIEQVRRRDVAMGLVLES